MEFSPGTVVAHYKIIEKLGAGGMATVYKAQDLKLERFVALKFLPVQIGLSESDTERFIQEAKTASALDHPNICTIYEINETEEGQIFISMAFCDGETVKDKIDRGPISMKEAVRITQQICHGLSRAHEKGIVHRDLKPANIIVTSDGVVKILDFGVAKFQHKSRFTSPGSVIGTPAYMSPEQATGKEVDHRTDIWALGVLLFQMLTSQLPFNGDNDMALMYSIVHDKPASLKTFRSQVPVALQESLNKALAKNPDDRYSSLDQLVKDLDKIDGEQGKEETKLLTPIQKNDTPSIAVLPLLDLSPEKDQEYFCDGLTEEIINALARVESLRVASRNTSFQFKDQKMNIGQIGEMLGVQKILEGSLRKSGDRIRVTIRLINVSDGFLVWSDDYERELKDIFAIQDDISRSVVQNLKVKLSGTGSRLIKRYTDDLEAYTTYLRGRFYWNRRTAESLEKSIEHFKRAIEIDPSYALAYAGLADAYIVLGLYGRYAPVEVMSQAVSAAGDALQIDEELAEAHVSLGCARAVYEWNWEEAERQFRRGIELKPEYPVAHHWYAINFLVPLGRFEEATAEAKKALELDPVSLAVNATVGLTYYFAGKHETAIDYFRTTLEMDPDFPVSNFFLGRVYVQTAQFKEATDHIQKALKIYGDSTNMLATFGHAAAVSGKKEIALKILNQLLDLSRKMYVSSYDIASIYCGLGDFKQALFWLENAVEERAYLTIYLQVDPIMDPLRKEERYTSLVRKLFPGK